MANTIIVKKGAGIPAPDQLKEAELALDIVDGSLYTKLNDGDIHQLNDGADSGGVEEAPVDGKQYARQDADWSEIVIPDGGTGSSVHIGDTPPASPSEGQQWMEVPADGDATMWVYDGGKWLQHPGGKDGADGADGISVWEQNGSDIYYSDGNVGVGKTDPESTLDVAGTITISGGAALANSTHPYMRRAGGDLRIAGRNDGGQGGNIHICTGADETIRFSVDPDGNVGIGMSPTRSTAKEQLAEWKSRFDARLKAEPKADKKAVTLEITDDAFEVMPTEEIVAEWMETRAAGDKLQVSGRVSFSNPESASRMLTLNASTQDPTAYRQVFAIQSSGTDMLSMVTGPVSSLNSSTSLTLSTPTTSLNFDNAVDQATFSGTVDAAGFTKGGVPLIATADLIETLATLRNATKDETTLEGLRDAIGNAVGGLIEKFEAMQSTATQEIES